jgi:hypothetical protein
MTSDQVKPHPLILNRAGAPPADGWYQIEVSGEHPAGEGRRQVIDREALESIVNRFKAEAAAEGFAGLLVDADHLSHDLSRDTAALAWLKDLDIRNGQLHGLLELTDLGEAAVTGRRYKFFSTEYAAADLQDLGDGRVRPLRLSGLALTNRPNNRGGQPISNRDGTVPPGGNSENTTNQATSDMKDIAAKLGLPPEATEAEVLTAVTDLLDKLAAMANKEAEAEAEAVLNRLGDRVPEAARPHWRAALIANRATAEPLLEASFPPPPPAAPKPPVFNRETAKSPEPVEAGASGDDKYRKQSALVASIRNREKCNFQTAWDMARAEKPELFN